MHESKKAADAHDKLLELAEQFTMLLEGQIAGVDEKQAEEFGLLLARNKEKVILACRGKPEVLDELVSEQDDKVTAIQAAG